MAKFDLHAYARRGAEARAAELKGELEAIYRAFPDLSGRRSPTKRVSAESYTDDGHTTEPVEEDPLPGKRRRRKPMTAAQKKAVGERMKKYWAARKTRDASQKR
jgi:hypothetical protein